MPMGGDPAQPVGKAPRAAGPARDDLRQRLPRRADERLVGAPEDPQLDAEALVAPGEGRECGLRRCVESQAEVARTRVDEGDGELVQGLDPRLVRAEALDDGLLPAKLGPEALDLLMQPSGVLAVASTDLGDGGLCPGQPSSRLEAIGLRLRPRPGRDQVVDLLTERPLGGSRRLERRRRGLGAAPGRLVRGPRGPRRAHDRGLPAG